MLPASSERVAMHTSEAVNAEIRRKTEENISMYGSAGKHAIGRRLEELDREWDVERALEVNAASVGLVGLALGATVNRKWYILPAVVSAFLLQHALQGWCPPVVLFRRLGFRTRKEIDHERHALKAVRGDFEDISTNGRAITLGEAGRALRAAERNR